MEEKMCLNEQIQPILDDYYATFDTCPFKADYFASSDLAKTYGGLKPEHTKREPERIETLKYCNGLSVPPDRVGERFIVLLNAQYVMRCIKDNDMSWYGTIAHETTHVVDFIQFAKINDIKEYDVLFNRYKNAMFQLWTEFNARAKGYYFVRKYTFKNIYDEGQIEDILQYELPGQTKILNEQCSAAPNDFERANCVAQYLGRLHALQQLFPSSFSDNRIKLLLSDNVWMYDWFVFLQEHTDLKKAYRDFDDMKDILKKRYSLFYGL